MPNLSFALAGKTRLWLTVFALSGGVAQAQSFDCAKARTAIEKAICASPELRAQDGALGALYARLAAGDPAQLRETQRAWLAGRDRTCAEPAPMAACLAAGYRARMAALEALAPAPADVLPADAAAPSASLSRTQLAARDDDDALLSVAAAGRLSIRVKSKTGIALQFVDMIAGPGEIAGDAGARDGRLDVLADAGIYKIRSFGAKDAAGAGALSVEPFRSAAPNDAGLLRGGEVDGELGDLQSRGFWIVVDASRKASVEAAGRSLQDLRLWRDGTDLAALAPAAASIEPRPGRPLTRLRLEGSVEPGLYLVTAYGGEALSWADGDTSQPFHIRSGTPPMVAGGWFEGVVGPFGTVPLLVPAPASTFRLELPEFAAARLSVARGSGSPATAVLVKNSREPVATATLSASGQEPARVEISGAEGQTFRLRALAAASSLRLDAAGEHLVAADVAGEGGDEVPATLILGRFERERASVAASNAPRVGPGLAWRRKFNLRGATTLLFEVTAAGPLAVQMQGPGATAKLEGLLSGPAAPRADGGRPLQWDVEAGWYRLRLDPVANAAGVLDLTFGPPGLAPDPEPAVPPRTAIDLGRHRLDKPVDGSNAAGAASPYLQLVVNAAPGLVVAPRARALPADLARMPLALVQTVLQPLVFAPPPPPAAKPAPVPAPVVKPAATVPPAKAAKPVPPAKPAPAKPAAKPVAPPQIVAPAPPVAPPVPVANGPLLVPVRIPPGGALALADVKGNAVAFSEQNEVLDKDYRTVTIAIAPATADRVLVLSWTRKETLAPVAAAVAEPLDVLKTGVQRFFDLARDGRKRFRLDVAQGGLMRVETTGLLKTSATISTRFLPAIDTASDNGDGHNARLASYLRAGSYIASVAAEDSAGHLGVVANPAPLIDAGALAAEGATRATMQAGSGALFSFDIAETGSYRVDLYGLGRTFTARLEDAEGWPLAQPGEVSKIERRFAKGRYRLLVQPEDVDARVVARLRRVAEPPVREGHGPFPLAFDATQKYIWREPAGKDVPRAPDRWFFALQGPAHVTLDIGEDMIADLLLDGQAAPVAKIAFKRGYAGLLQAGSYTVEARSLGRNDRLDYKLTLAAEELQPGGSRRVDLPATIPFAIAEARPVSLTSFGRTDLRAVLKDSKGKVIERVSGRENDWNIGLSRRLAAGSYKLELLEQKADATAEGADDADAPAKPEPAAEGDKDAVESGVEVRLSLPAATSIAAPGPRDPAAISLTVARSTQELVLGFDGNDADGVRKTLAVERGRAPVIAVTGVGEPGAATQMSLWPVDAVDGETIKTVALTPKPQPPGLVKLEPVMIDGFDAPLFLALVEFAQPAVAVLRDPPAGLRTTSMPGAPLLPAGSGMIAVQSRRLWLLARDGANATVQVDAVAADAKEIAVALKSGEFGVLPPQGALAGRTRVWRADSTFGQPGVDSGAGMGVAEGSALTVEAAGFDRSLLRNAGDGDILEIRASAIDLEILAPASAGPAYSETLPPRSVRLLHLPPGGKRVDLDLPAGAAAQPGRRIVWTGGKAVSRSLSTSEGDMLLLNTGDRPAPVALRIMPGEGETVLDNRTIFRRFFGAPGSFALDVGTQEGERIRILGGSGVYSSGGAVLRGTTLVPATSPAARVSPPAGAGGTTVDQKTAASPAEPAGGDTRASGELIVEHDAGPVVIWIEGAISHPWPVAEATSLTLPSTTKLTGESMRFTFAPDVPVLLHATSTAPLILFLPQGDAPASPILFPAGAALHRALAAGPAELLVVSATDGPLTGTLEVAATPMPPLADGLGAPHILAPGAVAAFSFTVEKAGLVGAGVRSDPDRATMRLMDSSGKVLGEGVAQMLRLAPGRYAMEVSAPADAGVLTVRPALAGLSPPPSGPPPDVAAQYLELTGQRPASAR